MCIRDSHPAVEQSHTLTTCPHQIHIFRMFKSDGVRNEGKACLLYTSDAADDLLCVDLGGRRLIKKKNKQQKP